jgi:uncharacterized RDD family membrane protein YckC
MTLPANPRVATGAELSSVGKRFGAYVLDIVLAVVTIVIGWLIWSFVTWSKGQTPAKSLMKMRTVKADTGRSLTWGGMCLREVVIKGLLVGLLSAITLGIIGIVAPLLILGGTARQTMWDRIAGTTVVDDEAGITL